MNVDDGRLINARMLGCMTKEEQSRYLQVPEALSDEAEKELQGSDEVVVDMTKDTPLVSWAKSKQTKNKKKSSLSKMQKASKKKNR